MSLRSNKDCPDLETHKTREGFKEQINTALEILVQKSEERKKEIEENISLNIQELVEPYINGIKKSDLTSKQSTLVDNLESSLNKITSNYSKDVLKQQYKFTPKEIRIADLIKIGKSNKEIADIIFRCQAQLN